jgi:hypothetical protein
LDRFFADTYVALNNDLRILAAIGIRTAFDALLSFSVLLRRKLLRISSVNYTDSLTSTAMKKTRLKFSLMLAAPQLIEVGNQSRANSTI